MSRKFNRNFLLFVDVATEEGGGSIEIRPPFTLEFEVNRNILSSASTATMTVYNLAEKTRKRIYKDQYDTNIYRGVELWAGYGDGVPTALQAAFQTPVLSQIASEQSRLFPRIFRGNVKQSSSVRNGVNFLTTIEAYDGGFGIVNGQVNRAFSANTPKSQILSELIQSLPGITVGAIGSFDGVIPRGNTYSGSPLDSILGISGGNFFIDGEKGYCLNDNEYIQGSVTEISDSTGLIGVPRKQRTIVTVDMLFEPGLTIGQGVQLNSRTAPQFNSFYKVTGVFHRGMISESVCGSATTTVQLTNGEVLMDLVAHQ